MSEPINVYVHKQDGNQWHADTRFYVDDFDPAAFRKRDASSAMYMRDAELHEESPTFYATEAEAVKAATDAGFRVLNGECGALFRLRDLEKAARALLDRLDEVHKASQDIYVIAYIHGVKYDGPTWNEQADKLRALLEGK